MSDGIIEKKRIYSHFYTNENAASLCELTEDLIKSQKESWTGLKESYEGLAAVKVRRLRCNGYQVSLQYNPGRIISTAADVDPLKIKQRRCFLCMENLPPQQQGIEYRHQYLILCNPFPIFNGHLTVSHIQHRPQAIDKELRIFITLVKDFNPAFTVFYNGAKCGASAPDHMHFQAAPRNTLPMEKESHFRKKRTSLKRTGEVIYYRLKEMGRSIFVLEGKDEFAVEFYMKKFIDALKAAVNSTDEPMLNLLGSYGESGWRIICFPRRKHRPDAYYHEGEAKITVSPGLVDMGGLIITPLAGDFKKLNVLSVMKIYDEVSLEESVLEEVLGSL
jgi:hypothetical protein